MKEKTEALIFSDNWKNEGIYFLGNENNGNEIVITKNDKRYVRGNQLYVEYNGSHIYASLDSVIYINTITNVIQIDKYKELTPPDKRQYLVLLEYYNEEQENTYQGFVGRQTVFDYIKSIADEIDLDKSLILTETVQYKDAINIYDFMKECIISGSVKNDDGFDIDDYNIDIEEEE